MGTSTFSNHTVAPEIAGQDPQGRAVRQVATSAQGVTTGIGAVLFTGSELAKCRGVGLGGIGLNVIRAPNVGADKIIGVDLNPWREATQVRHDAL
jgi:Zn-dependent alcohol dehydrogenase